MEVVGIILGLVVWGLVGAITGDYVVHKAEAGIIPGFVAGVWAAWPFLHHGRVKRYNFLHPVPRRYNKPLKQAFAGIRQILNEKTYNFGDKWHVSTADTIKRRVTATMKYSDEQSHLEGSSLSSMHMRKERLQRLIELDVQLKEEPNDVTVVQFDFHPKVEGAAWTACDSIIAGIMNDVEALLGPGTNAGSEADTTLPAPPWWLLGVTVLMLLYLFGDVWTAVFK
jgi:hypothetical protein